MFSVKVTVGERSGSDPDRLLAVPAVQTQRSEPESAVGHG